MLGFDSTGAITAWFPLMLFVILFGLSMDYHVFILSRIKEAVDRGESTEDAVAHGIKSTAGVVSAAALVMVAVFAIFATLSFIDMKQFGVGLAAAGADRRHARARRAAARDDEAARRLELVPAELARVAAEGPGARGRAAAASSPRPALEEMPYGRGGRSYPGDRWWRPPHLLRFISSPRGARRTRCSRSGPSAGSSHCGSRSCGKNKPVDDGAQPEPAEVAPPWRARIR